MKADARREPRRPVAIWLLRLALVASLVACSYGSDAFWRHRFSLDACLRAPGQCRGKVVETAGLTVEDKVGDTWVLRFDKRGLFLSTRSPLPEALPGDLLEASVTLEAPGEIAVHRYAVIRPWRSAVRTAVSILASGFVVLVWLRRRRTAVVRERCRSS